MLAGHCAVPIVTPSWRQAGCTIKQEDSAEQPRLGRGLKLCLAIVSFWELFAMSFEKRLGLVWAACGFGWIRLKCYFFKKIYSSRLFEQFVC